MSKENETSRTTRHGNDFIADVRRSYSKSYPKGFEITDDALIFINDTLQAITVMNEKGHREFKAKVRITFNYA